MGALGYLFFVSSINLGSIALLFVASFVNGLTGGPLWLNHGVYMVRTSEAGPSKISQLTALFYVIWNASTISGSILVIVTISVGVAEATVVWVLAGLAAIACIMMLFIPPVPVRNLSTLSSTKAPSLMSVAKSIVEAVPMMPNFFHAYNMQQGFNAVLSFGVLPTLISTRLNEIEYIILAYSIAAAGSGFIWSHLFDYGGFRALFLAHLTVNALASISIIAITITGAHWQLYVISGLICGLSDQGNNNISLFIVTVLLPNIADKSFAMFRVVFAFSVSLASIIALYVPYYALAIFCTSLTAMSIAMFFSSNSQRKQASDSSTQKNGTMPRNETKVKYKQMPSESTNEEAVQQVQEVEKNDIQ